MKYLLILLFLYCPVLSITAQDIPAMIKEADRLESLPDETAAFNKFREVLKIQPLHMYALVKCSELCSRIGKRQVIDQVRDDYYNTAKIYARLALKINPQHAAANASMAMVLGRSAMSKTGREKIENAREVKKYADAALKSDSRNFIAWHILGRWHYELCNLNFIEKAAVKIIYGATFNTSLAASVNAFEKAHSLAPHFILNYLEMAKAYKQMNNKSKAITLIKIMLSLPNQTEDDPEIKLEGQKLMEKWN